MWSLSALQLHSQLFPLVFATVADPVARVETFTCWLLDTAGLWTAIVTSSLERDVSGELALAGCTAFLLTAGLGFAVDVAEPLTAVDFDAVLWSGADFLPVCCAVCSFDAFLTLAAAL